MRCSCLRRRGCQARLYGLLLLLLLGLFHQAAQAQTGLALTQLQRPAIGATLPVSLGKTLRAGRTKVGTAVIAYTTQRIPITSQSYLPPGVEVHGTVVASVGKPAGAVQALGIRWETLVLRGQSLPLSARVLAIANFTRVNETYAPITGIADRGNPSPANWTTQQIGGDVLSRSGWSGELVNGRTERVGFADFHGVYADAARGGGQGGDVPHALGPFSAEARGLYGFDEQAQLLASGATTTVHSPSGITLYRGDALLLQVLPSQL